MGFPPYYGANFPGLPKTSHFPLEMADLARFPNLSGGQAGGFSYSPFYGAGRGHFFGPAENPKIDGSVLEIRPPLI